MAPSLLFHSNIATYPSEPDSFLAVVRLPKSASLDSIVITPLGLRPFYYHQPDSNINDGQTPTRPAEIDLLFNTRYPPSPLTQSATISTLPSIPSTKAPKGWKPNSLHKSTLSYNPFLQDSDGAPPGIDSSSPLAIQQFEIGMPLDVTTTLVVLRCPFSIITLSLYGYPSTSLSAVADSEESSMASWETYLYNLSAGSRSNLPNDSFENVLLSVINARPNYSNSNATEKIEKCGQNEEDMAVDGGVLKEIADHPLQERLNEILKSLTHLIESSEEASTLHNEDTTDHLIRDTSSQPSSSVSSEVCIELILLNLIHFSEILEFLTRQPSSSTGSQALLSSLSSDIPIQAIFHLLNWSTLAHWNEALAVSAQIWIDLLKVPFVSDRILGAFAAASNHDYPYYKRFYDLSSWRKILCTPDSNHIISSADQSTMVFLSRDLLRPHAPCDVNRTSYLSRQVIEEITPNGLFLFMERCISVDLVCTEISLLSERDSYEDADVELGWLVRWMDQKSWEYICMYFLIRPSTFSSLLRLALSVSSLNSPARKIVEKLFTSPVVSTSPCTLHSLSLLRSFVCFLPPPSPPISASSSKRSIVFTSAERLQIVIDCTEYTTSGASFEHFLSQFIHLAQSIPSSSTPTTIFQAHIYLLYALRSFPQISRRSMSSDRLMSRSFWIYYLGLTIELYETLTSYFWNGMEDLARTPPFVRLNHQESSAEHADGIDDMLGALGELGAGLMSLIDFILKIIIHDLPPLSRSQSLGPTSGRSKIDHLVETKTTDSAIIRATQNAISTFVRAELLSDLLSTNREDMGLIESEAERLKSGLDTSKATSLGVLNQLTSLSDRREDGNETRHEGEEKRIGLVLRTIIDYALGAGAEKAREIVGTIIGRLIPDPPSSSLSSTVSASNSSSIGWGAWDRILYDNSIHMSFLILILTSTSPSIQPFFEKIRLFPSLSTKLFDLSSPSPSPSVIQTNDDDVGVELVGKVPSTSILEWMFASPTSLLDTATGPISQTTSIITSNPLDGPISSIVPLAPTMTTTSTMTATAVPAPAGTMVAATVGGMLSAPIQRTSKTYRQNEFRSSRSSTLTLPPGVPLTVSPGPNGTVLGGSIGPGGGLGVGMVGSGGIVQKVNASRAPSKHVDEFELEIELESQRKRESGESRKMN